MTYKTIQYEKIRLKQFISASLKGFSQVLLVGHTLAGLLILVGILLFSPILGFFTFTAAMIGTFTGKLLRADPLLIREGIYGFNSVLCAITPILFLHGNKRWFLAIFAAVLAAICMKLLSQLLDRWGIPVLTAPFVFITWIGLLVAYRVDVLYMDPDFVISSPAMWNFPTKGTPSLLKGMVKGVGEVFVIDSLWTGSLILIGLFIVGWRFGLFAIVGAFVSWLTAFFIGVDTQSLNLGLYNYNAVLTIIAVGLIFNKKERPTLITAIIAATLTVPVTAGLEIILKPYGLPALTLPFILCTWLFAGLRKFFPNI